MEKKSTKEMLDDIMQSDSYKSQQKLIEERKKTIKRGNNVVHLEFLGELEQNELNEIENKLKSANLELSYFNKTGVIYNNLDQYSLVTYFVLSQPLVQEILKSIGMSATWDSIKWVITFALEKLKGKKYNKIVDSEIKESEMKFGFSAKLDENTEFNFELDGNLDKEIIQNSLNQAFEFLEKQKINESYKIADYVNYSKEEKEWKKTDVMEEISKPKE
jgi:hypothetical protein